MCKQSNQKEINFYFSVNFHILIWKRQHHQITIAKWGAVLANFCMQASISTSCTLQSGKQIQIPNNCDSISTFFNRKRCSEERSKTWMQQCKALQWSRADPGGCSLKAHQALRQQTTAVQQKSHWDIVASCGRERDIFQMFLCISSFRKRPAVSSQLKGRTPKAALFFFLVFLYEWGLGNITRVMFAIYCTWQSWCSWASRVGLPWFLTVFS